MLLFIIHSLQCLYLIFSSTFRHEKNSKPQRLNNDDQINRGDTLNVFSSRMFSIPPQIDTLILAIVP